VELPPAPRADVAMFGESAGRVLVSVRPEDEEGLRALAGDVPLRRIGASGGDRLVLRACGRTADLSLDQAAEAWERAIPEALAA
jgi:phosphoribosylformylglycinamidine synthase